MYSCTRIFSSTLSAVSVEYTDCMIPPIKPSFGRECWPLIFEEEILEANKFLTHKSKWLRCFQHSSLVLSGLDRQLENTNPMNQLVMSSLSTNIIISTVLLKLLLWQTSSPLCFISKLQEKVAEDQWNWYCNIYNDVKINVLIFDNIYSFIDILFNRVKTNHYHHPVMPTTRISLTLSRQSTLSFITSGGSSGLHPVSSDSCCVWFRAGGPAFARPCAGGP